MKIQKNFKPVPGDERATHEAFVAYVGGVQRAERLSRIYSDSFPGVKSSVFAKAPTKEEVFARKATAEGYTAKEISAYLSL